MLRPGDIIMLRECTLQQQGYPGKRLSVAARVEGPTNRLLPKVLLSAPAEIGACNQLVVDGTLSSIAGPQPPLIQWTVQGTDQLQHGAIDATLARASSDGDLQLVIDFPQLVGISTGFGQYSFNLTLQNTITGTVHSAAVVVNRKETDAPAVRLSQSRKYPIGMLRL
jgi:hypothetical protein